MCVSKVPLLMNIYIFLDTKESGITQPEKDGISTVHIEFFCEL